MMQPHLSRNNFSQECKHQHMLYKIKSKVIKLRKQFVMEITQNHGILVVLHVFDK